MGKPHPMELRERVITFVEEGHSHRAAASHFRVSPRFANRMVIPKRETGSLEPMRQGHGGHGKLKAHADWVRQRVAENGDLTLDELCVELAACGVIIHRSNVSRLLHRLGLGLKKAFRQASKTGSMSDNNVICGSTAGAGSSIRPRHGWCSSTRLPPTPS